MNEAEFYNLVKKSLQVYRIRLQSINQRNKVLQILAKNPQKITDEAVLSRLSELLRREKLVLGLITKGHSDLASAISFSINQLNSMNLPQGFREDVNLTLKNGKQVRINVYQLKRFVEHFIEYLNHANHVFQKIQIRMQLEEQFLNDIKNKKQQDIVLEFNAFLDAWMAELNENQGLSKGLRDLYAESLMVKKDFGIVKALGLSSFIGTPIFGAPVVAVTAAAGSGFFFAAVALAATGAGFLVFMLGIMLESDMNELVQMKTTKNLIKEAKNSSKKLKKAYR